MLKMIDVLEQNLVQDFIHGLSAQTEYLDELIDGIQHSSNHDFDQAIQNFLENQNLLEIAHALDIQLDRLKAIQGGLAMSKENIADTAKIVALCLALETDHLDQIHISDSLQEYPM